jgi:hypothetical protein
MFCDRCGVALQPNVLACPQCGRRLGDPVSAIAQSRLEGHLQTLGILWIVVGVLFAIPSIIFVVLGSSVLFFIRHQPPIAAIGPIVLYLIAGSLFILAIGGVSLGIGLTRRTAWARVAGIILGALALFHPPFGTALGIYTLWVLLPDEHGYEYQYLSRAA